MSKSQLRAQLRQILAKLSESEKLQQSANISQRLIEHPKFQIAKRIFIYLSTENEVDTKKIVAEIISRGKECFIPLVLRNSLTKEQFSIKTRMLMVKLNSLDEYARLPTNHYGIKEPEVEQLSHLQIAKPLSGDCFDLFVVPGLGFSLRGERLGHGKAYYDEFLFDWSSRAKRASFYTIGIGFRQQLVEDTFANDQSDFKIDELLIGGEKVG